MRKFIYRVFMALPALFIQFIFYYSLAKWLTQYSILISILTSFLSAAMILFILDKRMESNYKTFWLFIIFLFPFAGTWIYYICGYYNAARSMEKKAKKENSIKLPETNNNILQQLKQDNYRKYQTLNMLSKITSFPIVFNQNTKYYPLVDYAFEDMLTELKKAKKSIYLEFFIIEEGKFFGSIVEILKQKVKEGVEVYILYDDIGSIFTYSVRELKKLRKYGIHCYPFNPFIKVRPILNNRDHRKMMVIDNKVVFAGGFNLADEYINVYPKHGHWKDLAVRMEGDIVNSYSTMFINMWNLVTKDKIEINSIELNYENKETNNGYCISYFDSPANEFSTTNNLLVDLLSQATHRAWFYTPYLILNDSLQNALISCAKRGVDVKIIVPGVAETGFVDKMTKVNYDQLLENNVNIYEYVPGFVHGKESIFDDDIVTIGTVNLDYRSLFLHYENNCLYYKAPIVQEAIDDFQQLLKKCQKIEKPHKMNLFYHFVRSILKIISPLC